jgi:hypothetical protein
VGAGCKSGKVSIVMTDNWVVKKENLFRDFERETRIQLAAVLEEDIWRFTQSVEVCRNLIEEIKRIEQASSVDSIESDEIQSIGQEIQALRARISEHLPAWREKIRKGMIRERMNTKIKHAYDEKDALPPIFMDKRN